MSYPQLRILVDNTAGAHGLQCEHGLSMLIEAGGCKILFDAGQGQALEANCKTLNIELSDIDAFVLSHGHYDHTGAIDYVLQESPEVSFFAHPAVLKERYSIYPEKEAKDISMQPEERLLVKNLTDSHLNWVNAPMQIAPGVHLTGPIPREHPLEDVGGPFFNDPEGKEPDSVPDDMAMWIETPKGLLVICGCCHSGLINTLEYIVRASGGKRIWSIVGGLHLKNASEERLCATTEALCGFDPEFIVSCHCTGNAAFDYFKQNLTTSVHTGFAGFEL